MKVGLVTAKRPTGTLRVGRRARGGEPRRGVGARRAGTPQREEQGDDDYRETARRTLLPRQYRGGHQKLLRPEDALRAVEPTYLDRQQARQQLEA